MITLISIGVAEAVAQVVETVVEFLQTPEAVPVVSPIALLAAAPPPLPTFVPQGLPIPQSIPTPTAGSPLGGGSIGGTASGSGAGATGGGILPGSALAVRIFFECLTVYQIHSIFHSNYSVFILYIIHFHSSRSNQ